MKYANIILERKLQTEGNLGDYVQFIAIDHLYDLMGIPASQIVRIEYWDLLDYDGEDVILPINFFYFNPANKGEPILLSPKIHPVYLGLHLPGEVAAEEIEYFRAHTPIGCRDEYTYQILRSALENSSKQNEVYLQGCITATLPRRQEKAYSTVYIIDIPKYVEEQIPPALRENAVRMSQLLYGDLRDEYTRKGFSTAQEYVKNRFELYRDTAKLVITSRMHCAVPCMAMGIPVIFIAPVMSSRFSWMEKLLPIHTYDETDQIDWNPKPVDYEEQKRVILQSAINRIRGAEDTSLCFQVHEWYMDRNRRDYISGSGLELLYNYAKKNWTVDQPFEYLLWGVTATTPDVYSWISKHYPKARLAAVIDEFRDLEFAGIKTSRSSCLPDHPDCYYIGTGAAASMAMKKKLRQLGEAWYERGIPIIP